MHSFRDDLRAATQAAHAALDTYVSALDLSDRADYGAMLTMHAAVLPALENEAARVCGRIPALELERRMRTPALLADMESLDLDPPAPMPAAALEGPEQGLGLLYVLEGSRLGARILLRRVAESLDGQVRGATRYLAHGGGDRPFASYLEAAAPWLTGGTAREQARLGALMGFEAFDRACRRHVPPRAAGGRARG